jgi:hypothetical protein
MESAAKIKEILQAAELEKLPDFIAAYQEDPRNGVQKLVASAQKKLDALEKEKQRIENLKKYEKELMNTKSKYELQFMEIITDEYKKRQAIHFFENGYGISVVNIKSHKGTFFSYTQSEEEYEIAVLQKRENGSSSITYETPITDDVIGHLRIKDVYKIMKKIEKLK